MIDRVPSEAELELHNRALLQPGEAVEIGLEKPDYGSTPTVALIETPAQAPDQEGVDTYSLVDLRNAELSGDGTKQYNGFSFDPSLDYLIVADNADFDRGIGYKGLRQQEGEVHLGRFDQSTMRPDDARSRFTSSKYTSRNHFSLQATDSGILVRDTNSLYGTSVRFSENTRAVEANQEPDNYSAEQRDKARRAIDDYLKNTKDEHHNEHWRNILQQVAGRILENADAKVANEVAEVVVDQSLGGVPLTQMLGKWGIYEQYDKRIRILSIYERDSGAAKEIVRNRIGGFHGSQSGSLWSVLEHDGLLSAAEARNRGQFLVSGERTYSSKGGQSMISFADYREAKSIAQYAGRTPKRVTIEDLEADYDKLLVAAQQSAQDWSPEHPFAYNATQIAEDIRGQIDFMKNNPSSLETWLMQENFPIAYGLSLDGFDTVPTVLDKEQRGKIVERAPSGVPGEFLVMDDYVSMDHIPVLAVPKQYIEYVQDILKHKGKKASVIDISLLTE